MKNPLATLDLSKHYAQARRYAPYALLLVGVPGLGKLRLIRALAVGARATVGLEPLLKMLDGLKAKSDATNIDAVTIDAETQVVVPPRNVPAIGTQPNIPIAETVENPSKTFNKFKAKELVEALRSPEALAAFKAFGLDVLAAWESSELRRKMRKRAV